MKYSVVMPSFLGEYKGCAPNREVKFIRAVNSFLGQDYQDKELVIISDFCDITERIYNENFLKYDNIIFKKLNKKMPHFSGAVRTAGLAFSTGDRICYLDTDDFLGKNHITKIDEQFEDGLVWVYSDDYLVSEFNSFDDFKRTLRVSVIQRTRIGTSAICHTSPLSPRSWAVWPDGYGHDWHFIKSLLSYKHKKIDVTSYNVCHIPSLLDV